MSGALRLVKGSYCSYTAPFAWTDIPRLAIVSGLNGSGKTQLLHLLQRGASGPRSDEPVVTLDGMNVTRHEEVIFREGGWRFPNSVSCSTADVAKSLDSVAIGLLEPTSTTPQHLHWRQQLSPLGVTFDSLDIRQKKVEEIRKRLPIDALYRRSSNPSDLLEDFTRACYYYYLRHADLVMADRAITAESALHALGSPPWDLLDTLLGLYGSSRTVISPSSQSLAYPYIVRFSDSSGAVIGISQLSAGEQSIVGLALLIYGSERVGVTPKLLLLDEPDIHLHTSLVSRFVRALESLTVSRPDCTVILTTHRPDTILSAPPGSLFEVGRTGERIRAIKSAHFLIGRLSDNTIDVMPATRFAFVEGHLDQKVFSLTRDILADAGKLPIGVSLSFRMPDLIRGSSGGHDTVRKALGVLREAGLVPLVQGLLDGDAPGREEIGLHKLARPCIENYLYEPTTIVASLVNAGRAGEVLLSELRPGQEYLIRALPNTRLQSSIDVIASIIQPLLGDNEDVLRPLLLTNGMTLTYPGWQWTAPGKRIKAACCAHFGEEVCGEQAMLEAYRRLRVASQELADLVTLVARGDAPMLS